MKYFNKPQLIAIAAIQAGGGLGKAGKLLAHVPSDLSHFKSMTMGKPVIMGRKTWESLPNKALPGRICVVLSRSTTLEMNPTQAIRAESKAQALEYATQLARETGEIYIAGGGEVYELFLNDCDRLILTEFVDQIEPNPDTWFPEVSIRQWVKEDVLMVEKPNEPRYSLVRYLNLTQDEVN